MPDNTPAPTFPLYAFPPPVQRYLTACAAHTNTSTDLHAAAFLAIAGAALGWAACLQLRPGRPGWVERPVLWVAVVGPAGSGKSAALDLARQPLDHLQARLRHIAQATFSTYNAGIMAWFNDPTRPRPLKPATDTLLLTDPGPVRFLPQLVDCPGGCLWPGELDTLVARIRTPRVRQHLRDLWAHRPITVPDRNRPHPGALVIDQPVLGIVGTLPEHTWRLPGADHLLDRLLPVTVTPRTAYWTETGHDPVDADIADMTDLLTALRQHPANQRPGDEGTVVVRHPDAIPVWTRWFNHNVDRQQQPDTDGRLRGIDRKLPVHAARIALVLHALWHPDNLGVPLAAETMRHAIDLTEAFRTTSHRLCIRTSDDPATGDQRTLTLTTAILDALRTATATATSEDEAGWLTRTALYERTGRPQPHQLTTALDSLAEELVLESRRITPPTGRKPATVWRICPPSQGNPPPAVTPAGKPGKQKTGIPAVRKKVSS